MNAPANVYSCVYRIFSILISHLKTIACVLLFVPIIAPFLTLLKSTEINLKPVYCDFWPVSYLLLSTGLNRNQVTVGGISGGILCSVQGYAPNET